MMTDVGRPRTKAKGTFSFSLADRSDQTLPPDSGEGRQSAGLAAFVLRREFVSQLNPSSTKSGYNLETHIYSIQSTINNMGVVLKYKKCLLASECGLAVV